MIPASSLMLQPIGAIEIGSIVYLPGQATAFLWVEGQYRDTWPAALSADGPIQGLVEEALGRSALVLTDWRLEIDPLSGVEISSRRLPVGAAIMATDLTGFVITVGEDDNAVSRIFSQTGKIVEHAFGHALGYTRWRIVTGPEAPRSLLWHGPS